MNRLKPQALNREDAERLVGEIAELVNEQRKINTEIDKAIIAAKKRYEFRLCDLVARLQEKSSLVQAWAETHREEFAQRKSIEFTHGTIGFRTGTPKLRPLPRRTFEAALAFLLNCAWGRDFIRTKNEIDKEAILAAHAQGQFPKPKLDAMGLQVVQDESFFIDPKLADAEAKIQEAA